MRTPNQIFEFLQEYVLPFNLRQCFDAFRLNLVYQIESVCPPERMGQIRAYLDALTGDTRGRALGELFDPYRDRLRLLENTPPGDEISLLPMPAVIVETFSASPLAQLVDNEMKRVEQYAADLDDEGLDVMGQLTAFAFGSCDPPEGRAAILHYVTANVSWRVAQYLRDHPGAWTELPLFTVPFPNMVDVRRDHILTVNITPPFRREEVECFTEGEIREFGASQQATYASPRCRHFMICPRCFTRLMRWQNSMTDFLLGDPDGYTPTGSVS